MPYARPQLSRLRDVNASERSQGRVLTWDAELGWHVYTSITPALIGAALAEHQHAIDDVTGLQSALDGKAGTSHTHTIADVTNLQSSLDGKAPGAGWDASRVMTTDGDGDLTAGTVTTTQLGYLSGISSSIQGQLDGKAASVHTHAQSDVTGLTDALASKADLVGGVLPTSQLPALAIVEFLGSVVSESAMLALTGQQGDWCVRSDDQHAYFLVGDDPSDSNNWQQITTPGSDVTAVNGQTGAVVLGYTDVGAAATSHTHDQSDITGLVDALGDKADASTLTAHTASTSNPHSVTKSQVGLGNLSNDAQLKIASNLSDLNSASTARSNLGLGSLATLSAVTKSLVSDLETISTTSSASAIPKADGSGKLANGWLNTGSGNGLDADRLDGNEAAAFAKLADDNAFTGFIKQTKTATPSAGGNFTGNSLAAHVNGHSDGSSVVWGNFFTARTLGANAINTLSMYQNQAIHFGTNTLGSLYGMNMECYATNTGNVTSMIGHSVRPMLTSSGSVGTFSGYVVVSPYLPSTGTIGAIRAISISSMKTTGVGTGYSIYSTGVDDIAYFAGRLGIGNGNTSPTASLDVAGDTIRLRTSKTPASASASGNAGDICWDSSYLYVCVATNTWKRVALSSW